MLSEHLPEVKLSGNCCLWSLLLCYCWEVLSVVQSHVYCTTFPKVVCMCKGHVANNKAIFRSGCGVCFANFIISVSHIFFFGIIWPFCLLPTTLAISYSHIFWCIDGCSHNGIWKCKNSLLLLLFSPTFLGLVCLEAFFCKAWNQRKCLAFCQCLPHAISCDGNSVLSNSFNSVTLSKIIDSGKFRNENL